MRFLVVSLGLMVAAAIVAMADDVSPASAAPLPEVSATASGSSHTCALLDGGAIRCWGDNQSGQLGDGTTEPSRKAVDVLTPAPGVGLITNAVDIAAGRAHTCAIVGRDGVVCWGNNSSGQVGDGSTTQRPTPVAVLAPEGGPSLAGAKTVVAGLHHSCALLSSSRVACWGNNSFGQLGNGSTTSSARASLVLDDDGVPLASIRQITSGAFHSCALTASGDAYCWGNDFLGQRGDDVELERATDLVAGAFHTCGLLADGSVRCWGSNTSGQLGNGATTSSRSAVTVQAPGGRGQLGDVEQLTAGVRHTCARLKAGSVHCWGDNSAGQLGQGNNREISTVVSVVGTSGNGALADIDHIDAAGNHTCAVSDAGRVMCWGANDAGQLGDATDIASPVPRVVPHELTEVKSVTGGRGHTCVRLSDGQVNCWGANDAGQLGDGTTTDQALPVRVSAVGGRGELTTVTTVVAAAQHSCALLTGGKVACWGANVAGQLGDGTTEDKATPVLVRDLTGRADLSDVQSLSMGADHACALLSGGRVACWGANNSGQLGDGTATNRPTPTLAIKPDGEPLTGVRLLATGSFHTCATIANGDVVCWGSNLFGQLGDGTTVDRLTPVPVLEGDGNSDDTFGGVRSLSAGAFHSCAVLISGRAACWGANFFGQLGDGRVQDRSLATPVKPAGGGDGQLREVRELHAAGNHTCALFALGTTACWGGNDHGQLGDGSTEARRVPTPVLGADGNPLTGMRALAVGGRHACAMPADGRLSCWGANDRGQLGDGDRDDRPSPEWVATTI